MEPNYNTTIVTRKKIEMDAEFVTLATAAAAALVGKMTEDGWDAVKAKVAALFGRATIGVVP